MENKYLSPKKDFWMWAIPLMILFVLVALAPQFDLWNERGKEFNGVYAINEFDEFAYTAYVQAIKEGKPRRNSPFSGRLDSPATPQQESLFSIQFLSAYPIALLAKSLNLSISATMILLSIIVGALSALAIYWLCFQFFSEGSLAFTGTIVVLFTGALVAGQGSIISFFSPESVHYYFSMMFLRRTNPATSFFALFLFFVFVWRFFVEEKRFNKLGFGFLALTCFWITVYTYFYHWTTALAWFGGLVFIWVFLKFDHFKKNFVYIFGFGLGIIFILIPWFLLLMNRATSMDSAQLLSLTHQSDLLRLPEILSYLTIIILFISHKQSWINLTEPKFVFLLSLTLVSPLVFNQQIITGHSLQPFHYQYFCTNYISSLALIVTIIILANFRFDKTTLNKCLVLIVFLAMFIGYFDVLSSIYLFREQNIWRDKFYPVAEKIRVVNENNNSSIDTNSVILSFDFSFGMYMNSEDIPSLSSQPIMWSPHLPMFPDIDWDENLVRINKCLYYQNFTPEKLRSELQNNNGWLRFGYFGPGRVYSLLTNEYSSITNEEIEQVVTDYYNFYQKFSFQQAKETPISLVIVHNKYPNDFSKLDLWYQRDSGEIIGDYTLYRVKIKPREN